MGEFLNHQTPFVQCQPILNLSYLMSVVCFWPPVILAFLNYDVAGFQPQAAANPGPRLCTSPQSNFQSPQRLRYACQRQTNEGQTMGTFFSFIPV